jgi:hypothetical protein
MEPVTGQLHTNRRRPARNRATWTAPRECATHAVDTIVALDDCARPRPTRPGYGSWFSLTIGGALLIDSVSQRCKELF